MIILKNALSIIMVIIIFFTVSFPIYLANIEGNLWYLGLYAIIGIPVILEMKLLVYFRDKLQ